METGTLKELNVKPGDIVECIAIEECCQWLGEILEINKDGNAENKNIIFNPRWDGRFGRRYRIISRASDKPKLWRDMTDAEKGALLLAHHEGKVIEFWSGKQWLNKLCDFVDELAYRVKPEPESVIVIVSSGDTYRYSLPCGYECVGKPDLRVTFELQSDGTYFPVHVEPTK